ncbi:MAG: type II toxin-antitoxin system RelE family toxin [Vicinamibacteria bacterium]
MARQEPRFSPDALRQLKGLRASDQSIVLDGIKKHLVGGDPLAVTRNKFRLRRMSKWADYELRVGDWRVFYRVDDAKLVTIMLVGREKGNVLRVDDEEFEL